VKNTIEDISGKIELLADEAKKLERDYDTCFTMLERQVHKYRIAFEKCLEKEMKKKGKTWCTVCEKMIPESSALFLLTRGVETTNVCRGLISNRNQLGLQKNSFSIVERVCPACRKNLMVQKNFCLSSGSSEKFFTFIVRANFDPKTNEYFYQCPKTQRPFPVGEETTLPPSSIPAKLFSKFARCLGLHKLIDFKSKYPDLLTGLEDIIPW
jgi:hypothetical protein